LIDGNAVLAGEQEIDDGKVTRARGVRRISTAPPIAATAPPRNP